MTTLDRDLVDRAMSGDPDWRAARRRAAYETFAAMGMPTDKEELWKYVEIDFDLADFDLAMAGPSPESSVPPQVESLAAAVDGPHVAIVDGTTAELPENGSGGVQVRSLARIGDDLASLMETLDDVVVDPSTDVFAAAHEAFGSDGALVHVERNVTSPVVLVDITATHHGGLSFPRVVISTGESAHASVVVHLRSTAGSGALVIPRLEIAAGAASNVDVSVVQTLDRTARSIGHLRAVVGRDATVTVAEAGIGAALSRWHLIVDLEGRGSTANIVGAYFGDQEQILDYRYFMHHAGLNTTSDMFLKGAVEDRALSVFTGLIRIDEGAQRTDAFQTNRNLILSDGAAAQSVPNLEILANDVKCGHGSSVGPLDQEQRYYLMSRGLDQERADRLQVRGFFEEALRRFPHDEIAGPLRTWINTKFVEAQEAGRL